MTSQQPEFGRRLRHRRLELGLSQRQLAGDFTTPSYISLLETGRRSPTLDVLVRLAASLDMPVDALSGRPAPRMAVRSVTDTQPAGSERHEESAAVVHARVYSLLDAGAAGQARELLTAAMETERTAGHEAGTVELGLHLHQLLKTSDMHEERRRLLQTLLASEVVTRSRELTGTLLADLATAQRDTGQLVEAVDSAHAAVGAVVGSELAGAPEHIRRLSVLISILCELNELGQVETLVERMLTLARTGPEDVLGRAHWSASTAYSLLGRSAEAVEHLLAAQHHLSSPDTPLRDWLRFARSAAVILLTAGYDLPRAQEWLVVAQTAADSLNLPSESAKLAALWARYELAAGRPARAIELYDQLAEQLLAMSGPDRAHTQLTQSLALAAVGRVDEADALLHDTAALGEASGSFQLAVEAWKHISGLRAQRQG